MILILMHFEASIIPMLRNCILLLLASGSLFAADFHVATNGDDKNPGTQEKPFVTLERARDAIRALKKATPKLERVTNVIVHGGAYELKQPLELTAEDSGTPEAPIVYQADADRRALGSGHCQTRRRAQEIKKLKLKIGNAQARPT